MAVLYSDPLFTEHRTPRDHPECHQRLEVIVEAFADCPRVERRVTAQPGDLADVLRVHDADYVQALEAAAEQGGGALDPDTWVSPRSYAVALSACGTLNAALDASLAAEGDDSARRAFALVRPPGHHARPARGMGFCLFNNVAVAAERARAVHGLDRVAIVDFDVHHGNGTQESFWNDPAVLFVSLHRFPFYPGTGAADETGRDRGKGATLNLPLSGRTTVSQYEDAFRRAMERVQAFAPQLILASAGFDAYEHDPIGGLCLREEHYAWIGAELRRVADATCDGRLVATLEGGYALDALGGLARRFLEGMAGAAE